MVGPVLEAGLACRVERVGGYDTDRLGTFTREVPRAGTQLEAARRKARIGMELAGLPLGLGSEGSFGPDPVVGMVPWDVEVLLLIDDARGIEVVGTAGGRASFAQGTAPTWAAAGEFARAAGFPDHWLVVRPQGADGACFRKDIHSWPELEGAFAWAQERSADGLVVLESDGRAHANPTRQAIIRLAAENLVRRLGSRCPACAAPGFWAVERIEGLPCADCGAPTREALADRHGCVACSHREVRERAGPPQADPSRCDRCNP